MSCPVCPCSSCVSGRDDTLINKLINEHNARAEAVRQSFREEAQAAEDRFKRTHIVPYSTEQRMVKLSKYVAPKDYEQMDSYLERLWEIAR